MQEADVESAICKLADSLQSSSISNITKELATIVADSYAVSITDAYLLLVAAKLLIAYREAGCDIDRI